MTIHTPNAGTGLTGEWYVGLFGALRVDFGLTPRNIVTSDAEHAWQVVRDLVTVAVEDPGPLEPGRRMSSLRSVHGIASLGDGSPNANTRAEGSEYVAITDLSVVVDADRTFYRAPGWVARLVAGLKEPRLGIAVMDDTGHHQDALIVHEAEAIIAIVGLRRLS